MIEAKSKFFLWLLCVVLGVAGMNRAWADTCPTDATDTAVGVAVSAFRINPDGTTGPSVGSGAVGICECIRLRMSINYIPTGPNGKTAFFEGGTMTIGTLSGSFTDDVTPSGGIPLIGDPGDPNADPCGLGAVPSMLSDFTVDYCVNPADIVGGRVTFLASYVAELQHFGPEEILGEPTGTTAISVQIQQAPTCRIEPGVQEICEGASASFTAVAMGEAGPFMISWTGPGGFVATGATITIDDADQGDAGVYTATVTDANGCQSTCEGMLIVNPNPTCVVEPATALICEGLTQTFTVVPSGGTPPYSILWNNGETTSSITVGEAGTYTAVVTDSKGCTTSCEGVLQTKPCIPQIEVIKTVVCSQPDGTCPDSGYGETATGVKAENGPCPTFCYQITVRNPSPDVPLINVSLSDPDLDLSGCGFPTSLAPGESFGPCTVGPVEQCSDHKNTVTAVGVSEFDPEKMASDEDDASVEVLPLGLVCDIDLFSDFDMEGRCDVTLPEGSIDTPVQFTLTLRNTGEAPLNVVSLGGLPTLLDCGSGAVVEPIFPIEMEPGESRTLTGCVTVSCPGAEYGVSAVAEADDADGTLCVYDSQGNVMTVASPICEACVDCETPTQCRVTGGGTLLPGTFDESCRTVTTTIHPLQTPNGIEIKKITHGGQLGAPFSQLDCGEVLGNPCIRGQWQHTRHYVGKGNPRDVFDMNFHSATPKGQFDSLLCACLGCCDLELNSFISPITINGICNPDDHKICGPQPRPAPANAIIFSGVGRLTPETDEGANQKVAEWVVFRVYIEDRSEPGGFHPKGSVEPADVYCFQAWKTGIRVSRKPDFSSVAAEFRAALGQANCEFLNALRSGDLEVGTLPSPEVNGRIADIQDCGPMHDGNHQIHPATGAVCDE